MVSIKTFLLYAAAILAILGVTAVVTIKITNSNTYQTQLTDQQKKETKSHEAWRHLLADGPTDTPPPGSSLNNGKTILNDFHVSPVKVGEKNEGK